MTFHGVPVAFGMAEGPSGAGQIGKFDVRGGLFPHTILCYLHACTRNQQRENLFFYILRFC